MKEDSSETKFCPACGETKFTTQFYKHNGGLTRKCKICVLNKIPIPPEQKIPPIALYKRGYGIDQFTFSPKTEDYFGAYVLLKNLGYDLSKNISEQFCEKYNLPYREPTRKTIYSRYKSPEDFGLV